MPINRPTEKQLRDLGLNVFRNLSGSSFAAKYHNSFIYPLFAAVAKMMDIALTWVVELYYERFIHRSSEEAMIEVHAPTYKVERITAAYATGSVSFTGTNGATVPAGTFVVDDTGLRFETDSEVTITGGSAIAACTAENTGVDYNLALSTQMFLEQDIQGVDETATVSTAFTGGRDIESLDSWKDRTSSAISERSGTGSNADIKGWIEDSLGDVRGASWGRHPSNGEITIGYINLDPDNITPSSGGLNTANAYVSERIMDGITVNNVNTASYGLDFNIRVEPNTEPVREAIRAGLKEWFMLNSEISLDTVSTDLFSIPRSQLAEAVSIAAGEVKHEITEIAYSGTPLTGEEIQVPNQNIATLNNVVFQSYT